MPAIEPIANSSPIGHAKGPLQQHAGRLQHKLAATDPHAFNVSQTSLSLHVMLQSLSPALLCKSPQSSLFRGVWSGHPHLLRLTALISGNILRVFSP